MTILTSAYVASTAIALGRHAPVMRQTFTDLGADVGPLTGAVLDAGRPLVLAPLAILVVAGLVAKEIACRSVVTRGLVNGTAFVAWGVAMAVAGDALQEPMLQLMKAIG